MILKRLKDYIDYKDINISSFERSIGMSNASFGKSLKKDGAIGTDKLENILKVYTDINPEWLLTGNGNMIIDRKSEYQTEHENTGIIFNEQAGPYSRKCKDRKYEVQRIPLYNVQAIAGLIPLFSGQYTQAVEQYIEIPNAPKCDGAIHVTGDSMYPIIKAGDIIMYKEIHDIPDNIFYGEMYLIGLDIEGDEMITVKYIQKSDKAGYIKLVSQNQHHQDRDIEISRIRALAFIKASIRFNHIK